MEWLYHIADVGFFVFHILLILFNIFGWLYKPWRKWNLITLGLTAFSWVVLGIFYGFGYCFLTDWHWQVREALGYENPYNSYIQFLLISIFNDSPDSDTVDLITVIAFLLAVICSVVVNIRDHRKKLTHKKRRT